MIYDESQTIDLDNEPLHGGILVKTLVLSIDPYLRRRMQDPNVPDPFVSRRILECKHVNKELTMIFSKPPYKSGDL